MVAGGRHRAAALVAGRSPAPDHVLSHFGTLYHFIAVYRHGNGPWDSNHVFFAVHSVASPSPAFDLVLAGSHFGTVYHFTGIENDTKAHNEQYTFDHFTGIEDDTEADNEQYFAIHSVASPLASFHEAGPHFGTKYAFYYFNGIEDYT